MASTVNQQSLETFQRAETVTNLVNQIMFFMLCDRWFCPEEKLTGLYALLFYNILCYLLIYTQQLIYLHEHSTVVLMSEHSNVRHLAMTATKFMLEFTQAVTFVVTGVFMLLVFGLEQGLEHFNPTWYYIIVTAIYFTLTERSFQQKAPELLTWLEWDVFEKMELLWTPVIFRLSASIASGLMITLVFLTSQGGLFLICTSSFVNVYLAIKDMDYHLQALMKEKSSINRYRFATWQEICEKDDVCAVCLQPMTTARVTPCKHFFHGNCLRQCIKERPSCPLCKQNLDGI